MLLTLFISTFFIYDFGIWYFGVIFTFLVKTISLVLWGENLSPEFFDHVSSSFRLACYSSVVVFMFFPLHVRVRSSANKFPWTGGFMLLIMSLMPIKNRMTLIADPCGLYYGWIGEVSVDSNLNVSVFKEVFFIKASMCSFSPSEIRVFMILVSCTVSYALFDVSTYFNEVFVV